VRRSSRAEDDLIDIWLYIAEHNPLAADRLLDRLEARWQLLATQPRSGKPREDLGAGLRAVVVGEYLSIYRLDGSSIEIVRVLHGRRNIVAEDVVGG
jgi:toxin ParE1/3/4